MVRDAAIREEVFVEGLEGLDGTGKAGSDCKAISSDGIACAKVLSWNELGMMEDPAGVREWLVLGVPDQEWWEGSKVRAQKTLQVTGGL